MIETVVFQLWNVKAIYLPDSREYLTRLYSQIQRMEKIISSDNYIYNIEFKIEASNERGNCTREIKRVEKELREMK